MTSKSPLDLVESNVLPSDDRSSVHHRRRSSLGMAAAAAVKTVAATGALVVSKDAEYSAKYRRVITKNIKTALPMLVLMLLVVALLYRVLVFRHAQEPVFPQLSNFNRSRPVLTCEETANGDWTREDIRLFHELRKRCLASMIHYHSLAGALPPCGIPAIYFGIPVRYACFRTENGHMAELVNPKAIGLHDTQRTSYGPPAALCKRAGGLTDTTDITSVEWGVWYETVAVTAHEPPRYVNTTRDNGCQWKTKRREWSSYDARCIHQLMLVMNGFWPCSDKDYSVPDDRLIF